MDFSCFLSTTKLNSGFILAGMGLHSGGKAKVKENKQTKFNWRKRGKEKKKMKEKEEKEGKKDPK